MDDPFFSRLLGFARELRAEGVNTSPAEVLDFFSATASLGPADLYWVGRVTLLSHESQIATYDRVFLRYWGEHERARTNASPTSQPEGQSEGSAPPEAGSDRVRRRRPRAASRAELLRGKNFARMSDRELIAAARLMRSWRIRPPTRLSRRRRQADSGRLAIRSTIRGSFKTANEPIVCFWEQRKAELRRIVLVLDISGSMASYGRPLLLFLHSVMQTGPNREVFTFGTRLTHITNELSTPDLDRALQGLTQRIADWEGGTRIGDSLHELLGHHDYRRRVRSAIVIICSDGLEVGDPERLGTQMRRLKRLAHRVVWVNPLKATKGYEPSAGGMRAALPHVDLFVSGHNLDELEDLGARLTRL
ncbi:MAG: vWA domain-containing protein [bacterium]